MPYHLATFGSYTIGGRLHKTETGQPEIVNFTRDVSYEIDPRGTRAIEHAYVQFYVPEQRRDAPPIVLLHGGGMSGSCWETTPDGRPGWLHLLLERGFEVHVMDNVERGRAGFAPGVWTGDPILRTIEEAWSLFRFGDPRDFEARKPFQGQKFPTSALQQFASGFVPRWFSTTEQQALCLLALLKHLGSSIVVCHSQGAQVAFDVLGTNPDLFDAIVALEPSGDLTEDLAGTLPPTVLVAGGFLDSTDFWQARLRTWRDLANGPLGHRLKLLETDTAIEPGHSHMLMMDRGNDLVLDAALRELSRVRDQTVATGPLKQSPSRLPTAHVSRLPHEN